MGNEEKILKKLEKIFQIIFDDYSLRLSKNMTAEDIEEWDSLNQIKIILACEKEFSVKLNVREINNFANIGEMVTHLSNLEANIE
jgi:acyl carrier protein|tara:strand:- start:250 stop:504 length:255 start_codon:yes stop_codon:yes gene_type:complete